MNRFIQLFVTNKPKKKQHNGNFAALHELLKDEERDYEKKF